MPNHRTWVEIDERALANNIHALRGLLADGARFCAVVKANAYGHGQKEVVQIASRNGVDAFAVDSIDDALELRRLLPSALILTLGYVMKDRLDEAVRERIELTVYDRETLRAIESAAAQGARTAEVHLKIETGTHRQGVNPEELGDLLDAFRQCPHVNLAGVSTHFATIEDTTDTRYATLQLERFDAAVAEIRDAGFAPEWIHCACSAGIILFPATHGTLVRAGIALYGLWSSADAQLTAVKHMVKCDLTPVLTWKTRVAQVKAVAAGEPIGYGLTEVTRRPSRIAVLPVGYWDGYDRGLSSVGEVLIAGTRCKVMGRVCMNMLMVDVSPIPNVAPEQEAVLLGSSGRYRVTAEELAHHLGTISYEVVTRINPLIPRIIV